MTAVNLPHGTTRSDDMSAEVRYAWKGDTLTEHDLDTDGGTTSWKLWRDDEVHAMFDSAGVTEIDLENDLAVINGRAYGVESYAAASDIVPLDDSCHYLGDDLLPLCDPHGVNPGGFVATPVEADVTCTYCLGNLSSTRQRRQHGIWGMTAAILLSVSRGEISPAEYLAHLAEPEDRAAMLGMLATAVRLLGTAEEQTPDAPLVIDPRINGLGWVSILGESALEIHTDRTDAPEIYLINPDGEHVRLPH